VALVISDRVKETTTTTGTGNITLAGAVNNFETFTSNLSDGDTTYYAIVDGTNNAFEVGLGTFTASGTTLARTTIIASSNSNNAVDLAAGTKEVFITVPADKMIVKDAGGNISVSADTDITAEFGRAHIGNVGFFDIAGFSHVDSNGTGSYAIAQNPSGATFVNAADGQVINFNINNSDIMNMSNLGLYIFPDKQIIFEGSTADGHETFINVIDPTADRAINFPDASGTISLTSATETLTNKTLTAPTITTPIIAEIDNSGDITLDAGGDIVLDAAGSDIFIKYDGASNMRFTFDGNGPLFEVQENDKDFSIGFSQSGAPFTALRLDGSANGNAIFNGSITAPSLDISGDVDVDGTLEADAITVNGTALATVIAGTTVTNATNATNATLATTVTVSDSTANTNFPVVFHDESNGLLDDTGALRYNPSTGELLVPKLTVAGTTTTVDTVTINAQNAIVFEGATADSNETTLTITDPTADRTITLPDATGTVALTASPIFTGTVTANGGVSVDNITIDGSEIDLSSGDLTVDVAGDIILDADGGDIHLQDGGVSFGSLENSSSDFVIKSSTGNKDIIFKGLDFTTPISALTLDMSNAGKAIFNAGASFSNDIEAKTSDGAILKLETSNTGVTTDDVLGRIEFKAPNDTSGGAAIKPSVSISAVAKSIFGAGQNKSNLVFKAASTGTGDESEKMILEPEGNLIVKSSVGAILKLQTSETTIVDGDVLGAIEFSAPNEGDGADGDARLVGAAIVAEADDTFTDTVNDTDLVIKLGGSETAIEKARFSQKGGLKLTGADADTNPDPTLTLFRDSASPADGDFNGSIYFAGTNSADEEFVYAAILSQTVDVSDTTEDGKLIFRVAENGTPAWSGSANSLITLTPDTIAFDASSGTTFGGHDISNVGNLSVGNLSTTGDITAKTSDGAILKLQTSDTTVEDGDVIGAIEFSAPDEASGSDAVTTAASIVAEADQEFSTTINRTDLVFNLGVTGPASEKMRLEHGGSLILSNVENNGGMTINGAAPLIKIESSGSSILGGSTLGRIRFSAPNESSGGDAITTAAQIDVVADSTFDATNNKTNIEFKLGSSGTATEKMRLEHDGTLVLQSAKITGLADPTNAQEAATKAYVDANAGGGGGISTGKAIAMAMVFG